MIIYDMTLEKTNVLLFRHEFGNIIIKSLSNVWSQVICLIS